MPETTTVYGGQQVAVDEEGFLLNVDDWQREMVADIARSVGIEMTDRHWEVVDYIRDYFEANHAVPELRTFLKHLREKYDQQTATRKYVYSLFPYGFGQQACKIAGMRKPRKLMLDV
ncbi:MAG: TusE/DsrC/DsvC family sulfur relay protein [Chromatiales bacterium]|jgi:tRNA 2-thiouridine synthesizing protein E